MLSKIIRDHAAAQAAAEDWVAVAEILNAPTVEVHIGKVGGKDTLSALIAAGINPGVVVAEMRADALGSELLDTLIASGVDWNDPLTTYVMGQLVGAGRITAEVAEVVRGLSVQMVSPAGRTVTAAECQESWSDLEREERRTELVGYINEAASATAVWVLAADPLPVTEDVRVRLGDQFDVAAGA